MNKDKLNIDEMINTLIKSGGKSQKFKEKDVSALCKQCREVFMQQPVFLELEAPIKICGKWADPIY
jgi:serine/threonine-protein phosphatase PP1 catalytic subunit